LAELDNVVKMQQAAADGETKAIKKRAAAQLELERQKESWSSEDEKRYTE
jgi:hypothetical protein